MKMKHLIIPSLLVLGLAACNNSTQSATDTSAEVAAVAEAASAKLGTFGIALEHMDTSVQAGDNFFEYVNGTWLKNTEIPSDRSRYGSFSILRDQAEERTRRIIENAASKTSPSADEKRIGDFYNAYLDTETIEAKGLAPVQADLDKIRAAASHKDILMLMADVSMGLDSPVSPYVYIDAKKNDEYAVYLTQSGLGLPNRNYYFDEGEKSDTIRAAYVDFIEIMLTEAGVDDAAERAKNVMAFETALAEGHWDRVKQRNRDLTYNKMSRAELNELAPGMMLDDMMETLGLGAQPDVIVREKSAVENAAKVFAATDVDVLKDYLTASLLSNNSGYLPAKIDDASFDFFSRKLRGQDEPRPRWKRAVSQVNSRLGEVVGKVYVKEYFPPSSKSQMQDLVENLRGAFKEGIDNLEWMGEETKAQAQYKLAKFNPKIGYPDKWETYEGLTVDKNDLIGTVKSARAWSWNDSVSQLGGPIDRDEWGMTPQTVNAYYNSVLNEIVFPAAILDAPFFDPNADPAVNYGGIGAVIGHEMGHGFDDQGRKSDGDGIQRPWLINIVSLNRSQGSFLMAIWVSAKTSAI